MGDLFARYRPANGRRQPRIQYQANDPEMAVLEELRQYGGFRRMNSLYLQALKLGAEVILKRAAARGEWVRAGQVGNELSPVKVLSKVSESSGSGRPPLASDEASVVEAELSPVKVSPPGGPAGAGNVATDPAPHGEAPTMERPGQRQDEALSADPVVQTVPTVPDAPRPPVRRAVASSAAAAQFAQFGD